MSEICVGTGTLLPQASWRAISKWGSWRGDCVGNSVLVRKGRLSVEIAWGLDGYDRYLKCIYVGNEITKFVWGMLKCLWDASPLIFLRGDLRGEDLRGSVTQWCIFLRI